MSGSQAQVAGDLASHARGRTLASSFGTRVADDLPRVGALLVFGKEHQTSPDRAAAWVNWAETPGRVLIVLPPFDRSPCNTPVRWEARRAEPLAGGETALGKLLARERRHEIRGQMLPLERTAGQVVTAAWRRHPAAGLVIVTALPLWSLAALDHRSACYDWLEDVLQQAGKPSTAAEGKVAGAGEDATHNPTADEWTMLLHLCTGPFADRAAALDALARSSIHRLHGRQAASALDSLTLHGLVEAGGLNSQGEQVVLGGPYAAYARALRRRG